MLKESVKLAAPWTILYNKIKAMFEDDRDITIIFDQDDMTIKLYVNDNDKAMSLDVLLKQEHIFGETTVHVEVMYPNRDAALMGKCSYEKAFEYNTALDFVYQIDHPLLPPFTYVVFKKKVVQYFTDDLGDLFGVESTLYEDIARDIFDEVPNVFFCTNTEELKDHGTIRF